MASVFYCSFCNVQEFVGDMMKIGS